jgi:DNA-binding XRE family transcriptional regulator
MEHNPKSRGTDTGSATGSGSATASGETPTKGGGAQQPAHKRATGRASRVSSRRAVKAVEAPKPEAAKPKQAPAPSKASASASKVSVSASATKATKQSNGVRAARIERMMSKAELARRAGLSVLTIDRVEKGLECRMDTKRKVLEALGLRPEDRVRVFGEEE